MKVIRKIEILIDGRNKYGVSLQTDLDPEEIVAKLHTTLMQSNQVEAQVMQKPAGKKEFSMKEILISALAEMEKKLYMVLLKNGKKFEYYDSDFENTDFDEYTLDEHYDPDRGI